MVSKSHCKPWQSQSSTASTMNLKTKIPISRLGQLPIFSIYLMGSNYGYQPFTKLIPGLYLPSGVDSLGSIVSLKIKGPLRCTHIHVLTVTNTCHHLPLFTSIYFLFAEWSDHDDVHPNSSLNISKIPSRINIFCGII